MADDRETRAETARLYGSIMALRFLLEQTWARAFMDDPDPLAACDATAEHFRDRGSHGDPGLDPDLAYAVDRASEEEIERFFRAVRTHIESELERRARGRDRQ